MSLLLVFFARVPTSEVRPVAAGHGTVFLTMLAYKESFTVFAGAGSQERPLLKQILQQPKLQGVPYITGDPLLTELPLLEHPLHHELRRERHETRLSRMHDVRERAQERRSNQGHLLIQGLGIVGAMQRYVEALRIPELEPVWLVIRPIALTANEEPLEVRAELSLQRPDGHQVARHPSRLRKLHQPPKPTLGLFPLACRP